MGNPPEKLKILLGQNLYRFRQMKQATFELKLELKSKIICQIKFPYMSYLRYKNGL